MSRGKHKVMIGCPTDAEHGLHKLVRAHANTCEYVPALMVMIYILSRNPVEGWLLWAIIIVTFCRYLFVAGMLLPQTMNKPNPMRFLGMFGTYVIGAIFAIEIIRQASLAMG